MNPDAVRNWWFWDTPDWEEYCAAYGSPFERPVHEESYVVDLSLQPWKHLSKGHRSAIKSQMGNQHLRRVSQVDPFHLAHTTAAGRETRCQETWDLMQDWLDDKKAVLITNSQGGWAYVVVAPPGAYYFSAAGKDCHWLQYWMIEGLQVAGFDWYELGQGHTDGIRTFKSGFTNLVVPALEAA